MLPTAGGARDRGRGGGRRAGRGAARRHPPRPAVPGRRAAAPWAPPSRPAPARAATPSRTAGASARRRRRSSGGLALARALTPGVERSDEDLFEQAATIEGHPDNVAPAVFGGFTVAVARARGYAAVRLPVHPDVRLARASCRRRRCPPRWPAGCCRRRCRTPTPPHNAGGAALLVAALDGSGPSCCSRRPRTGSTRPTARRRCPRRSPSSPSCGAGEPRRWSPAPGRPSWCSARPPGSRADRCVADVVPGDWRRLGLGVGGGVATLA